MEKQDASTFASWGVDYLKYDNCYNEGQYGNALISYNRYNAMSQALNATGKLIQGSVYRCITLIRNRAPNTVFNGEFLGIPPPRI